MMIFSIGAEPDHKVAINPRYVTHITPQGRGTWSWIHIVGGQKFLVDEKFGKLMGMLTLALENGNDEANPTAN